MFRTGLFVIFLAVVALSYAVAKHQGSTVESRSEKRVLYYVDPMHPAYRSPRPGIAPDCGMKLEPVYASTEASAGSSRAAVTGSVVTGSVVIDEAVRKSGGIQVTAVESGPTTIRFQAVGRVAAEDTRTYRINSGTDGFIRETMGDSAGTLVQKDQKLATYYAPEFLTAASGFLAANERLPGSVTSEGLRSIQNYTDRLRNLGMSDPQIEQVATTRKLPESIDVIAPVTGVILARNISTGEHFQRDMELYRIADLTKVWVIAEVDEQDEPMLRSKAGVKVTQRDTNETWTARLDGSLPESENGGGTVKIRLEAENPGLRLRPDMLVNVEFTSQTAPAITVPADAVIDSGVHAHVYVDRGNGVFAPQKIETGWRRGDRVQVTKGLRDGERVVASGAFLVDSESRLEASGAE